MVKKVCLLLLMAIAFSSCLSKKEVYYFQGIEKNDTIRAEANYELRIKSEDKLNVLVSSTNYTALETVAPFNQMTSTSTETATATTTTTEPMAYTVDKDGNIKMPLIGSVKAGGLTKVELENALKAKLVEYIPDPVVNITIQNFRFSVIGEVNKPNTYIAYSDKVTVLDALAQAGDLAILGQRKDVLLIREIDGVKTHYTIDLTDPSFMYSKNFYIQQGDVLYVRPHKLRVLQGGIPPGVAVIASFASVTLSILLFITR